MSAFLSQIRHRSTLVKPLGEALLAPTKIYVKTCLAAIAAGGVRGIAHITGGGLVENIPRVLPDGIAAAIGRDRWPALPVFDWIAEEGAVPIDEMERTFNMGIGMVLIVEPAAAGNVKAVLAEQGEQVFEIGRTVAQTGSTVIRMES